MSRFGRVLCRFGRHQPTRAIDKINVRSVGPWGVEAQATETHYECRRCGRRFPGLSWHFGDPP